jgi:hypothetical protein
MLAEQKKPYRKPVLERVVLIPEENVLAVCATSQVGIGFYGNSICWAGAGGGCYGT